MSILDEIGGKGQKAPLFPVLAESSKEGRTLSVVLAVLAQVPEFSASLLNAIGKKHGKRTSVETFTEVNFPKATDAKLRPDGLIAVSTGRATWTAFVEAKIGNAPLKSEQIESYLKLARQVGVDAVITFTNDFAPLPEHHPIQVDRRLLNKVSLYHFSWFSLLTMINLLALNDDIEDEDHVFLLSELQRFLLHNSAGLKRFDSMGAEWPAAIEQLRSGSRLLKSAPETASVVANWHSELRDLCLLLSRKTGANADIKLPPKHRTDPRVRLQDDAKTLSEKGLLSGCIQIPNLAGPIEVEADLNTRTARTSMRLDAPKDKAQQRSRLNWLLRQLKDVENPDAVTIIANWPGRAPQTTSTLAQAIHDESIHVHPDRSMLPHSFIVMKLMSDGRRFAGRKTFVESLETLVVDQFYGDIAERLTAWRPPAPKLRTAIEDEPADNAEE